MAESLPVSLTQARDRTIERLSAHFARDDLSLEELEQRIERAYRATNLTELDALTADLSAVAAPASARSSLGARGGGANVPAVSGDHERVVSIMSETKRRGVWAVPQELDVFALMSDTLLDLTQATLPGGVVDIHVRSLMAAVKIIVPPGVHVVDRLHTFMASTSNNIDKSPAPPPGAPVIRISGFAMMAEVKVRVRVREEPFDDG